MAGSTSKGDNRSIWAPVRLERSADCDITAHRLGRPLPGRLVIRGSALPVVGMVRCPHPVRRRFRRGRSPDLWRSSGAELYRALSDRERLGGAFGVDRRGAFAKCRALIKRGAGWDEALDIVEPAGSLLAG